MPTYIVFQMDSLVPNTNGLSISASVLFSNCVKQRIPSWPPVFIKLLNSSCQKRCFLNYDNLGQKDLVLKLAQNLQDRKYCKFMNSCNILLALEIFQDEMIKQLFYDFHYAMRSKRKSHSTTWLDFTMLFYSIES